MRYSIKRNIQKSCVQKFNYLIMYRYYSMKALWARKELIFYTTLLANIFQKEHIAHSEIENVPFLK